MTYNTAFHSLLVFAGARPRLGSTKAARHRTPRAAREAGTAPVTQLAASRNHAPRKARKSQILTSRPFVSKWLDIGSRHLGCWGQTRLESRIKKFTPHCICRPFLLPDWVVVPQRLALHPRYATKHHAPSTKPCRQHTP